MKLIISPDLAPRLEALYREKNRRCYVDPDPLVFLYRYPDPADREIAGLAAASLAYGNVRQILKSVAGVLDVMGKSPSHYIENRRPDGFLRDFDGFVHRFATGAHIAALLSGVRRVVSDHGSLMAFFRSACTANAETYLPALGAFADALRDTTCGDPGHLLPRVEKGSACKRLNLYLRWMIRKDAVDPGGWDSLCPSRLIIPLDVHMHRVCRELDLTNRRQADMKAALEITRAFSEIMPEDPVRYDFVLTRRGIRKDSSFSPLPQARRAEA